MRVKKVSQYYANRLLVVSMNADRWKLETLTALTARSGNDKKLMGKTEEIHRRARDLLSDWLSGSSAEFETRLQRDILSPAIRLHQDLRTSVDQFRMDPPRLDEKFSPQHMIKVWQLRDAESWALIKKESQIGKTLCCLHPSLVRSRGGSGASLALTKPVVVIAPSGKTQAPAERNREDALRYSVRVQEPSSELTHVGDQHLAPLDKQDSVEVGLQDSETSSEDDDFDTASSRLPSHLSRNSSPTQTPNHLIRPQFPQISFTSTPVAYQGISRGLRRESQTWSHQTQQQSVRYSRGNETGPPRRALTYDPPSKESKGLSSGPNPQLRSLDNYKDSTSSAPAPGPDNPSSWWRSVMPKPWARK